VTESTEAPAVSTHRWWHVLVLALLALLAWIFVDVTGLLEVLGEVRLAPLLLLIVLGLLDRFLMAAKWSQLLAAVGVHLPLGAALSAYFQASFVNRIVPTTLGGDLVRGVRASTRDTREHVVASMVMEKVIGVLGAVALAAAGAVMLVPELHARGWGWAVWIIAAAGVLSLAALVVSLSDTVVRRRLRPLSRLLKRPGLARVAGRLHDAYRDYRKCPSALVIHFLLTVLEQIVQVAVVYVCARAVGAETPALALLAVIAVSELFRKVAWMLEGWGLGELARILFLTLVAMETHRAVAIAILYHAVAWVVALPGAVLFVINRRGRRSAPASARSRGDPPSDPA